MKILKVHRSGKKVFFDKEEAFVAFTKEGVSIDMPPKLQASGEGESEEKIKEIEEWIAKKNPSLNDFLSVVEYLYGQDDYDSSHLNDNVDEREMPPDYIVSQDVFINASLGDGILLKESGIHEMGLFADRDIKKGEFIHHTHVHHYGLKRWVNLSPNYKYNHSSKNDNCEVIEGNRCMKMIALKDIKKGEELLVNYQNNVKLESADSEWE